jgi:hypothetical protein
MIAPLSIEDVAIENLYPHTQFHKMTISCFAVRQRAYYAQAKNLVRKLGVKFLRPALV